MHTAYLIPDTPGATMAPDAKGVDGSINQMVPRSFITNLRDNATVQLGVPTKMRGIAFGGDTGLKNVAFSADGGTSWRNAAFNHRRALQLSPLAHELRVQTVWHLQANGKRNK